MCQRVVTALTLLLLAACAPGATRSVACPETSLSDATLQVQASIPVGRYSQWLATRVEHAARMITSTTISLNVARADENSLADYFAQWEATCAEAWPDIIYTTQPQRAKWTGEGKLLPLEACGPLLRAFDALLPSVWDSTQSAGRHWGVPLRVDFRSLYYNRQLLAQLGWPEAEIDRLPERVRTGSFSLPDMLTTAQQAIVRGVVEPGYSYWPVLLHEQDFLDPYFAYGGEIVDEAETRYVIDRMALLEAFTFRDTLRQNALSLTDFLILPNHTWSSALLWRDAIAAGRVLFWGDHTGAWDIWANDYFADQGGLAEVARRFGFAPFPAALPGQPGFVTSETMTLSLTAAAASSSQRLAVACQWLANTLNPELDAEQSRSGTMTYISPLREPQFPDSNSVATQVWALAETARWTPPAWHYPDVYRAIVLRHMQAVDTGAASPAQAAEAAIAELRVALAEQIVVR